MDWPACRKLRLSPFLPGCCAALQGLMALMASSLKGHPNVLDCLLGSTEPDGLAGALEKGFVHKPFHGVAGNSVRIFTPKGVVVSNPRTMEVPSAATVTMSGVSGEGVPFATAAAAPGTPGESRTSLDAYREVKPLLLPGVFQEYVPIVPVVVPKSADKALELVHVRRAESRMGTPLLAASPGLPGSRGATPVPAGLGTPLSPTAAAASLQGSPLLEGPFTMYPVLSAWVVEGKCAGFIMRESDHPVTYDETSVAVVVLPPGVPLP